MNSFIDTTSAQAKKTFVLSLSKSDGILWNPVTHPWPSSCSPLNPLVTFTEVVEVERSAAHTCGVQ